MRSYRDNDPPVPIIPAPPTTMEARNANVDCGNWGGARWAIFFVVVLVVGIAGVGHAAGGTWAVGLLPALIVLSVALGVANERANAAQAIVDRYARLKKDES